MLFRNAKGGRDAVFGRYRTKLSARFDMNSGCLAIVGMSGPICRGWGRSGDHKPVPKGRRKKMLLADMDSNHDPARMHRRMADEV